jgi:hypothetical protein
LSFVKRVLDRRPVVLLARHGAGVDHPATDLGYRPVGDYASTVPAEIDWLVNDRPDLDDGFFAGLFDYAAEDRYLADRVR